MAMTGNGYGVLSNENAATSAAVIGMNGDDGECLVCVQCLVLGTRQS